MENQDKKIKADVHTNVEPPTKEYLQQLQEQAIAATKEEDATFGEQLIREGLQTWPELIDEELRKFKKKVSNR